MTLEEAKAFMKTCIQLACGRDGSSGGIIRMVSITSDKIDRDYIGYSDWEIK